MLGPNTVHGTQISHMDQESNSGPCASWQALYWSCISSASGDQKISSVDNLGSIWETTLKCKLLLIPHRDVLPKYLYPKCERWHLYTISWRFTKELKCKQHQIRNLKRSLTSFSCLHRISMQITWHHSRLSWHPGDAHKSHSARSQIKDISQVDIPLTIQDRSSHTSDNRIYVFK